MNRQCNGVYCIGYDRTGIDVAGPADPANTRGFGTTFLCPVLEVSDIIGRSDSGSIGPADQMEGCPLEIVQHTGLGMVCMRADVRSAGM